MILEKDRLFALTFNPPPSLDMTYDWIHVCFVFFNVRVFPQEWEKLNYDIYTLRYTRREVRSRWKKILLQLGDVPLYLFVRRTFCPANIKTALSSSLCAINPSSPCRISEWGGCFAVGEQTEPLQSRAGASGQGQRAVGSAAGLHLCVSSGNWAPRQISLRYGTNPNTHTQMLVWLF